MQQVRIRAPNWRGPDQRVWCTGRTVCTSRSWPRRPPGGAAGRRGRAGARRRGLTEQPQLPLQDHCRLSHVPAGRINGAGRPTGGWQGPPLANSRPPAPEQARSGPFRRRSDEARLTWVGPCGAVLVSRPGRDSTRGGGQGASIRQPPVGGSSASAGISGGFPARMRSNCWASHCLSSARFRARSAGGASRS